MSLKEFFARSHNKGKTDETGRKDKMIVISNKVFCMNTGILNRVTSWTEAIGWKCEDFTTILKLIGLEEPIYLSNSSLLENSFIATTKSGEMITIVLNYAKFLDRGSEIIVIKGSKTKKYRVHSKTLSKDNKPFIFLNEEIIEEENGEIHNNYSNGKSILIFPNGYKLEIVISPYSITLYPVSNVDFWQQKIHWYLVSLLEEDVYPNASSIFSSLKDLLRLSDENIKNINELSITFIRKIDKNEIVKSKFLLREGVLHEYASLEKDETFYLWRNGDWKYFSDKGEIIVNTIMYNNQEGKYYFTTTGTEKSIVDENLGELFIRVKDRISSLRSFF